MVRPMRVLCAPNAFKGSLSALEAARAMARGVRRAGGRPILLPVADGGDGTAAVLGGKRVRMIAAGPHAEPLRVEYRRRGTEAVIEVAQVGLARTKRRDPLHATSEGVGDMIRHAALRGARRILVALGGSATVDAGLGMTARLPNRMKVLEIVALCDVRTRLADAARVFGPQKGASPAAVRELSRRIRDMAAHVPPRFGRLRGSGAAGGIGWALAARFGAELRPGAEFVLEALHFNDALRQCDLVLTGEGRWDGTTREGKAPWEVMRGARRAGVRCVALCGTVEGRPKGVRAIAKSPKDGMQRAAQLLEEAAYFAVASCAAVPGSSKVTK